LTSAESPNTDFAVSKKGQRDQNLAGIGGQGKKLKYVYKYELGLGQQDQVKAEFYGYSLEHIFNEMDKFKPVGIIGGDVMRRYGFQIDFRKKCVRFRNVKP